MCEGLGLNAEEHVLFQSKFCSAQGDGARKESADVHGGWGWIPGLKLSVRWCLSQKRGLYIWDTTFPESVLDLVVYVSGFVLRAFLREPSPTTAAIERRHLPSFSSFQKCFCLARKGRRKVVRETQAAFPRSPAAVRRLRGHTQLGAGLPWLGERWGCAGAPRAEPSRAPHPVMRAAGMLSSRCLPLLCQQQSLQQ